MPISRKKELTIVLDSFIGNNEFPINLVKSYGNWYHAYTKYNEYMKETMKKSYERNPKEKNKKDLARYYYKKECKRLYNILLNYY